MIYSSFTNNLFVGEYDDQSLLPTILEEEDFISGESSSMTPHLKVYSFTQWERLFISTTEFDAI